MATEQNGSTGPAGSTASAGSTGPAGATPPHGWQLPRDEPPADGGDSIGQLVEELLALVPDDLRLRLTQAVRQLLEALKALIDWCVTRLEQRGAAPVEVHDIPIL